MYKIDRVTINGFWGRLTADCSFDQQVNIIIGKNGTGKTTFMNILEAVLSVDVEGIIKHDFSSVEIYLSDGQKKKTIKANKLSESKIPFGIMEYKISNNKYAFKMVSVEDRRYAGPYYRRMIEEANGLKETMSNIVSVSSISVYRLRHNDDYEVRDRNGPRLISPVDYRLNGLIEALTHYQLTLSQQARTVASSLQKEVLASILYSEEDAKDQSYRLEFDKEKEKESLVSAYQQLNAFDSRTNKKISFHVNYIDETIESLKQSALDENQNKKIKKYAKYSDDVDIRSLESLRKSRKIVEMSLAAERETENIYSQINLFISILNSFISDKVFDFKQGTLSVSNSHNTIMHDKLSSGEKQLLILLIEALLQKQEPHVFLADEPELSLHIEWQSKIIPAVVKLNPNAQVVVATHSPEVASGYPDSIYDMEALIHG